MTTINIFTENIFEGWKPDEKDIIEKTRKLLEFYISELKEKSCLNNREYSTITLDIVLCDSEKTHEYNRDYRNKDYPADIITFAIFADSADDEKFILKRDSSKLKLSQSEYIRNLIIGYEIKIPEVKEEPKPQKEEYIIKNIVKALEENIECLIKVKNKFHYLGYFEDERAIGTKIEFLKILNSTVIKKLSHSKDNAN